MTTPHASMPGAMTFAELQQQRVRKATRTFAELQAEKAFSAWLPDALNALADVAYAAVYPDRSDSVQATVEQRLTAVANSVDEFKEQLVMGISQAIKAEKRAAVRKTVDPRPGSWL